MCGDHGFASLLRLLLRLLQSVARSVHESIKVPDTPFSVREQADNLSSAATPLCVEDIPVSLAGRVVENLGDVEAREECGEP